MGCEVCGQDAPEHIWRCEKHFCCDVCRTKEDLLFWSSMLICKSCHDKRVRQRIAAFDDDTYYRDEIICPWCGDKSISDCEGTVKHKHKCSFCGQKFDITRKVDIAYTTTRTGGITTDEFTAKLRE